jgi:hypothetical protein
MESPSFFLSKHIYILSSILSSYHQAAAAGPMTRKLARVASIYLQRLSIGVDRVALHPLLFFYETMGPRKAGSWWGPLPGCSGEASSSAQGALRGFMGMPAEAVEGAPAPPAPLVASPLPGWIGGGDRDRRRQARFCSRSAAASSRQDRVSVF